jgi:hypothetical protein
MTLLASQIAVWLVVSALFGFAVGWLARGRGKAAATPKRRKRRRFPR